MTDLAYLESGAVLQDRYEVLREVGRGGYSVVYAARDRQLGQTVALKLLMPPPAAARLARERMRREVQVVRGLMHPNIVAVYDFVDAGARSFIVMEYVAGPDLHVRVRDRGPLSPEEAGRLGQDVAAALDAAHRRGILHRDVKPQNVLLDPDGRARLTDFGSAKLETLSTLTQTGGLVGTLDYAAPEVVAGRRGDARSDIYGLGVTLHFALAARLPERPSPHLPPPPAPEGYRPRAFRPDLPAWLDSVIARATAAEPDDRFPTAAALGGALAERAEQDEFGPRSTVALLESCLVCGTPDPFGVGVCAACRGDSRGGADVLVFVERTSRGPARRALVEALGSLLGSETPAASHRSAARGERPLLRVPAAAAGRVVATLDARGIPARAVAIGGAWGMIPAASYGLVALVLATGVAAGVAAVPMLVWTSPLVAALMLGAAGHGIRTPLSSARRPATRLPPGVERRIIGAFVELPPGPARSLLADLVRKGRACHEALSRQGDGRGIGPALEQVLVAACGAASDLAQLDDNLASLEAQRDRFAVPPAGWLDALARCERVRDGLAQRLLDATTALGTLRTEAVAQRGALGTELSELTRELEAEAAARAAAAKEVAELLATG